MLAIILFSMLAAARAWPGPDAVLRGRVATRDGDPLAGVAVTASSQLTRETCATVSDAAGRFECRGLAEGPVEIDLRLSGFRPAHESVSLAADGPREWSFALEVEGPSEHVEVSPEPGQDLPSGPRETLDAAFLEHLPEGGDDAVAALALLPGVLKAGSGLAIRGGWPAPAAVQLDATSLNDPSTGDALVSVPVDAVDFIEVLSSPTGTEFGRFASGLAVIHTRPGGDSWRLALNNLDPTLRTRRGRPLDVSGIGSFAPRLAISGPLAKDKVYLAESLQYRHSLSDVRSRPESETTLQEYLSSVTRLDARLSEGHTLTALLDVFPNRRTGVNLGTFNPLESTFDQRASVFSVALSELGVLSPSTVLESSVQTTRNHLQLAGHGTGAFELGPQGSAGRYFNSQQHTTTSWRWTESVSLARADHLLKLGFDVQRVDYAGSSQSAPIELRRGDGSLAERITFGGPTRQALTSTDLAVFVQDQWKPVPPLMLQLGGRVDRDGVVGRTSFSPRLGAVLDPARDGSLTLRAGIGIFAERAPSILGVFGQLEDATFSRYAVDGATPLGVPTELVHRTASDLAVPKNLTWSLALDRRLAPALFVHAGYLSRAGRDQAIVEPVQEPAGPALWLSSRGRSLYREAELSLRYAPSPSFEAMLSYVRSSSEADLNAYAALFGTLRSPVVGRNQYGPTPTDVPDRVLGRLRKEWRRGWALSAAIEWRTGFPYSALDEYRDVVGPQNRAGRFPAAALLDVLVERRVRFRSWSPWLGVSVRNALNAFAPRDVQASLAAPDYGAFFDSQPRRVLLLMRLQK